MTNNLFPIFIKLQHKQVLIIGAGKTGIEKTENLRRISPDARIRVVAKEFHPDFINKFSGDKKITIEKKSLEESDLEQTELIISATDAPETNARVKQFAAKRNILVNFADQPELCDFYLGAVAQKGDLKIAISTNGKSPTLARRLKEFFNESLPEETDNLLENLNQLRKTIKGDLPERIKELNKITSSFEKKSKQKSWQINLSWQTFALTALAVLALMLSGYFLFSWLPLNRIQSILSDLSTSLNADFFKMIGIGALAQLIDGAFGMAYGVTVTSFLIAMGVPASFASASMHTSEIFTTGTASLSYLRYKNINNKLFMALVIPGAIGAFIGASVLSLIGKEQLSYIKPIIASYTLVLGILIIKRALEHKSKRKQKKIKVIFPIAAGGGFLDSVGGGGWGPIVTSSLVAGGRSLRYTIGSAHLAKFFVAIISTITFILFIGFHHWYIVLALILGGMITVPVSIYFGNKIPQKTGLTLVGLAVIIISIKTILSAIL